MPDTFIIMTGNPVDGFSFYGSYPSREEAAEDATVNITQADWWIVELQPADMLEE